MTKLEKLIILAFALLALFGLGMLFAKYARHDAASSECDRNNGVLVSAPFDQFVCLDRAAVLLQVSK
jgi:hypothetical protein